MSDRELPVSERVMAGKIVRWPALVWAYRRTLPKWPLRNR